MYSTGRVHDIAAAVYTSEYKNLSQSTSPDCWSACIAWVYRVLISSGELGSTHPGILVREFPDLHVPCLGPIARKKLPAAPAIDELL